jgi:hypothetical protein
MTTVSKPYKPLLVLDPEQHFFQAQLPENVFGLALEMDLGNAQLNKKTIASFINGRHPFLLLIRRNNNLVDQEALRLMMLCLFSKNYIQINGAPVIAFYYEYEIGEEEQNSLFSQYLVSRLQLQGWSSIVQWHFFPATFSAQIGQQRRVPLFIQAIDFNEACLENHFFTDFYYVDNYILFRRDAAGEALRLEQAFFDTCCSVLSRNLLLRTGLQEYLSARHSAAALNAKNSLLRERLHNAEKTIDIIRSKYKNDYDSLFTWYHNEYEILPLWYKRFGHILKVLTGKRTFKSLFYDNVKKYRN